MERYKVCKAVPSAKFGGMLGSREFLIRLQVSDTVNQRKKKRGKKKIRGCSKFAQSGELGAVDKSLGIHRSDRIAVKHSAQEPRSIFLRGFGSDEAKDQSSGSNSMHEQSVELHKGGEVVFPERTE